MMKWGRKKSSSSLHSSRLPSLSRVLPTAWLSTFKRMSINSEPKPAKEKQQQKRMSNSVSASSSKFAGDRERFFGGDGEAFWRLSFGEDSADGKTSKTVSRSAWYDSDDELDFAPSSCRSWGSNAMRMNEKEETKRFSNTACDLKKMKEVRRDTQILPDMNAYKGDKGTVIKTPRSRMITEKDLKLKTTNERAEEEYKGDRETVIKTPRPRSRMIIEKDLKLKTTNERAEEEKTVKRQNKLGEAQHISAKSVEKNPLEPHPATTMPIFEGENLKFMGHHRRHHQHLSNVNLTSNLTTTKEDSAFTAQKLVETDEISTEKLSFDEGKWKEIKIGKVKQKSDKQRKSLYVSRELPTRRMKQNNKVRVFSPRTASRVEICKIKALEDMKKAKLKIKAAKQKTINRRTGLENFAMVKCSFDPEKDFRDSMIEMIMEKRISQPEELEELLACYLTLNSDVYHDLIIKVFQQVWFDLDQASSDPDLQNGQCSCDYYLYH